MLVGIPTETYPDERRVALVPASLSALKKAGIDVLIEPGCGERAGYPDSAYVDRGAKLASARAEVFESADVILQVRAYGANPVAGRDDLALLRQGQVVIGHFEPLTALDCARQVAETGATLLAMEMIPRITRAQSMDVLSSMATLAGYKAVLLAAEHLPKIFPMMMTAAGTIAAARVLIIGAGVAGLSAIATARRLGAVVHAYDVRPVVKEQVLSLGAKFVEMELEADTAEAKGGYAREMNDEFYRKQRELMTRIVGDSDVVITTAAIPGRKSPVLVTEPMVGRMAPGSVVVDLAAERGGNCELTEAGETVVRHGVTILGPMNLPSTIPYHASQMYAKNLITLLLHLVKDGELTLDTGDEIVHDTLVTQAGAVVHPRIKELMGGADKSDGASSDKEGAETDAEPAD